MSFQDYVISAPARYVGGPRGSSPTMIVMHCTAGDTAAGAVSWLNRLLKTGEAKASYHYLIDRDDKGRKQILRTCDPLHIAYHAGRSCWPNPPAPTRLQSVNRQAIGVAWANDNGSDDNPADDPLTEWQYEAGLWLVTTLCRRFQIPSSRVLGHCEVARGRKTDPLPRICDMGAFRRALATELAEEIT